MLGEETTMTEHELKAAEYERHSVSEWYEQCIEWLLRRRGMEVQREPAINGKTPDLMVRQTHMPDVIIECLVKLKDPEHEKELAERGNHTCGGDIRELHSAIYSRVEEKATKYRNLVNGNGYGYVIAVYDDECGSSLDRAMALAFSAHVPYLRLDSGKVVGRGYKDLWSTPEKTASLFKLHPHLSGLLYSRWERKHCFLPNPFANVSVPTCLFPFAVIPDSPLLNGTLAWKARAAIVTDEYRLPPNTLWGQVERLVQALKSGLDT